jgi:2-oxo-4-hydroxy-4-carboxy--5-ureidoimidazoline (OHCU) decarboxylase
VKALCHRVGEGSEEERVAVLGEHPHRSRVEEGSEEERVAVLEEHPHRSRVGGRACGGETGR